MFKTILILCSVIVCLLCNISHNMEFVRIIFFMEHARCCMSLWPHGDALTLLYEPIHGIQFFQTYKWIYDGSFIEYQYFANISPMLICIV